MQDKLAKLRRRLVRFVELLQAEESGPPGENGDKKQREQYLHGKIEGLTEAISVLEGKETEESAT